MIVDIRTRIIAGRDPFALVGSAASKPAASTARPPTDHDPTAEGHRRAMGSVVDVAAIAGWRADRLGLHVPAEQIAAWVNDLPDRRIGFAGIDASADSSAEDIHRAVDLGCIGLTMSPADQGVRPTDDRVLASLEAAAARRLPVLIGNPALCTPASVLEFARPALLDEAARTITGLTLVLGDLAHGYLDDALAMAAKHDRVFVEISGVIARPWSLATTLLAAHERNLTGKLLFASGFPAETPERAIERLYTLGAFRGPSAGAMPGLPRESVRSIVERDTLAALGIDAGALGRAAAPLPAHAAPIVNRRPRALERRA